MAQLVAKRYADALFEVALESQKLDEFEVQVQTVSDILQKEKEFMEILQHPQILMEKKITMMENIFSSQVSKEFMGLMVVVIQKNRQQYLLDILNAFLNRVNEEKGIVKAMITSSVPLKQEQLEKIQQKLQNQLNKQVEIETNVDSSIIGGLMIRVGDRIIDGTIQSRLQDLKNKLYDLQLA